ncbi:MAG: hypothetical protein CML42_07890 [Rhodobacteraceae bacterium]|nr:hypothetical protein [Paracoccaceae bacterium]|tara:strand:- start:41821 stop:43578 length:1758 start_codon:yes stop_codon:yes gene_type:complete
MEVAIPVLALGVMYLISNKENIPQPNQENYENINNNHLPNVKQQHPTNYPKETNTDLQNNVCRYPSETAVSDKYFQKDRYEKSLEDKSIPENTKQFTSLTGNKITKQDLKHNNMVPFFGSKVTQRTGGLNGNESVLDSYSGSGTQFQAKREQAPLFKPEKQMNWAHGTPNHSEFIQNRMKMNVSGIQTNNKPWEEIKVGPGLGKRNGVNGSGGFNSGMEARELYQPKTVDDLRVESNPKNSYGGVVLGAKSDVQHRGIMGKMEKNRPDTFSIHGPDRWFTTTGAHKENRDREEYILREENRIDTTREYYGGSGDNQQSNYVQRNYKKPNKTSRENTQMGNASLTNKWTGDANNYGKDGYYVLPNNRTTNKDDTFLGAVSAGVNAVITPILDSLRPSRKENLIGNMNPAGYVAGPGQSRTFNPSDRPKTTIKEQTIDNQYIPMGGANRSDGYITAPKPNVHNQRDSTNYEWYAAGSSGTSNVRLYGAEYNARLNPNKEVLSKIDRINVGNSNLFNNEMNVNIKNHGAINEGFMGVDMPKSAMGGSNYGELSNRNLRERNPMEQRNQGELLSAFNNNPYTQSLQSYA